MVDCVQHSIVAVDDASVTCAQSMQDLGTRHP